MGNLTADVVWALTLSLGGMGYVWALARVVSHAFFTAKLKYQRDLISELEQGKVAHG